MIPVQHLARNLARGVVGCGIHSPTHLTIFLNIVLVTECFTSDILLCPFSKGVWGACLTRLARGLLVIPGLLFRIV